MVNTKHNDNQRETTMRGTVLAVDLGQGVEDAFSDVMSFIPKLLGFLLILAIG
jgi:hypothetical protein